MKLKVNKKKIMEEVKEKKVREKKEKKSKEKDQDALAVARTNDSSIVSKSEFDIF